MLWMTTGNWTTGLQACTPMDTDADLWDKTGLLFENISQYRRLIDRLVNLTLTRSDIAYVIGLVSQFIHKPRKIHKMVALKLLTYIKGSPGKELLYKSMESTD